MLADLAFVFLQPDGMSLHFPLLQDLALARALQEEERQRAQRRRERREQRGEQRSDQRGEQRGDQQSHRTARAVNVTTVT